MGENLPWFAGWNKNNTWNHLDKLLGSGKPIAAHLRILRCLLIPFLLRTTNSSWSLLEIVNAIQPTNKKQSNTSSWKHSDPFEGSVIQIKKHTFGPLGTAFGTPALSTGSMCPSLKTSHWNSVGTHEGVNMLHVESTFREFIAQGHSCFITYACLIIQESDIWSWLQSQFYRFKKCCFVFENEKSLTITIARHPGHLLMSFGPPKTYL